MMDLEPCDCDDWKESMEQIGGLNDEKIWEMGWKPSQMPEELRHDVLAASLVLPT